MMPDAFYRDLPSLSDTEVRILIVAYANQKSAISIREMQARTGRTRQIYEAIKTLEHRGILTREKVDDQSWYWRTVYGEMVQVSALPDVEAKPKKTRATKTPPAPKPPTAQQHPAVLAYAEVTRCRPSHAIAEHLAATVTDIDRWKACVRDYVMQGWNPLNVSNMIRLYNGELKIGSGQAGRRKIAIEIPHAPAADTQKAWERYLSEHEGGDDAEHDHSLL